MITRERAAALLDATLRGIANAYAAHPEIDGETGASIALTAVCELIGAAGGDAPSMLASMLVARVGADRALDLVLRAGQIERAHRSPNPLT